MGFRRGLIAAVLLLAGTQAEAAGPACVDRRVPLDAYLSSGTDVVAVILSPRMPYALQRWPAMAVVAREHGFQAIPLRDPRVPLDEWQAAVAAASLPGLRCIPALDLAVAVARGVLHHAPSSLVARCGHLHPWPILGVMPDTAWARLLMQRHASLGETACHAG